MRVDFSLNLSLRDCKKLAWSGAWWKCESWASFLLKMSLKD